MLIISALSSGEPINFGGVILIWPFPIIIGAGPEAKWMVLFALILTFFMFLIFLIFYRKTGKL
ncbi:DUF131 domain-containing protein [Candidatus Bathyarchaeota archaeon]|nr:DUF131 domain-containing protein [Candidatus Bathyarchaeota archaeon]